MSSSGQSPARGSSPLKCTEHTRKDDLTQDVEKPKSM